MSRNLIVAGLLGLGLMASRGALAADLLPTTNAASGSGLVTYTFGTGSNQWTVTIDDCNETLGGTTVSNDCSNEQVIGTVTNNGNSLALTYENQAGTGTPMLSATIGGSPEDISLMETITAPSGRTYTAAGLSFSGTVQTPGTEGNAVNVSEVDNSLTPNLQLGGTLANGSPYTQTQTLKTPTNTITVSKDMSAGSAPGTAGNIVTLTQVTETFNVPEPASIALFSLGLGGLLGLRRRKRPAR